MISPADVQRWLRESRCLRPVFRRAIEVFGEDAVLYEINAAWRDLGQVMRADNPNRARSAGWFL